MVSITHSLSWKMDPSNRNTKGNTDPMPVIKKSLGSTYNPH